MSDKTKSQPQTTELEPFTSENLRRYLYYGTLVVCALLALVATIRLYLNASAVIDIWIEPPYRPLFQGLFNLVVLLLAAIGIVILVRRLS